MNALDPKTMSFVKGFGADIETMRIIHYKGRTVIAAFDGVYQNRPIFSIRELYEQYGQWNPGKGISVPIDKKRELLLNLYKYITEFSK